MRNLVGVMQGRLSPKYKGRYQAHPVGYWNQEFHLAAEQNLDCIEFILDLDDYDSNPLIKASGINEICTEIEKTGVLVKTICADYFMEEPFHSESPETIKKSQEVMRILLRNAAVLEVTDIVIPCVDQSSITNEELMVNFIESIKPMIDEAETRNINLCLETDLAPADFASLLSQCKSNRVTVNYDIGNSAALGFDPLKELEAYGRKITDIHIKDRYYRGESVVLGEGDADFKKFFGELKKYEYQGPFIMQAYRDDEGLAIFRKQLDWFLDECWND